VFVRHDHNQVHFLLVGSFSRRPLGTHMGRQNGQCETDTGHGAENLGTGHCWSLSETIEIKIKLDPEFPILPVCG
jgi:hypothetical protein